jgi:hypothetical protein
MDHILTTTKGQQSWFLSNGIQHQELQPKFRTAIQKMSFAVSTGGDLHLILSTLLKNAITQASIHSEDQKSARENAKAFSGAAFALDRECNANLPRVFFLKLFNEVVQYLSQQSQFPTPSRN